MIPTEAGMAKTETNSNSGNILRHHWLLLARLGWLALFLAMLALPLFAVNTSLTLPIWMRWLMRLAVIPLALAALSPVWTPAILTAPEFRQQTILAALAIGLAVIAPLLKKIPLVSGLRMSYGRTLLEPQMQTFSKL